MSEVIASSPLDGQVAVKRNPIVYFIDDSATMREVIKIAFRRENIQVITCADAASALAQFEEYRPDIVITDVIMPDQDGYSVCSQIKQHPQYGNIPVLLMSGVVNKSVADKAVAVRADELIRKPFQPQELLGRVKNLLEPKTAAPRPSERPAPNTALHGLFAPPPVPTRTISALPQGALQKSPDPAWPRALAEALSLQSSGLPRLETPGQTPGQPVAVPPQSKPNSAEATKLRSEIARFELLVKKLQTELQLERQYNQALELQIRTLLESE
jgi:CheY-like chemotaxis protein